MLKRSFKRALVGSRALQLVSRLSGNGAALLMYHSVQDDPRPQFDLLGGIIHSTKVFHGQMETIARHFNPVTLEDVLHFVRGDKDLRPRSVLVTFDDGYLDNYEVARPVLSQLGIFGVFYVVVGCIERQKLPWPAQLRHSFLTTDAGSWSDPAGNCWPLPTREERLNAYGEAAKICATLTGEAQTAFLEAILRELRARPMTERQPMMTWEQIRSLDQSGHTIGSHTMTHPSMAQLCPQDAEVEFRESKRRLEQMLGKPMLHFSYPCPAAPPHWADHTVSLSRKMGYQTAVTTAGGMVRKGDNPLTLKRIRPTKTVEGLRWNLERTFAGAKV